MITLDKNSMLKGGKMLCTVPFQRTNTNSTESENGNSKNIVFHSLQLGWGREAREH